MMPFDRKESVKFEPRPVNVSATPRSHNVAPVSFWSRSVTPDGQEQQKLPFLHRLTKSRGLYRQILPASTVPETLKFPASRRQGRRRVVIFESRNKNISGACLI